jgi:hypothetical protein
MDVLGPGATAAPDNAGTRRYQTVDSPATTARLSVTRVSCALGIILRTGVRVNHDQLIRSVQAQIADKPCDNAEETSYPRASSSLPSSPSSTKGASLLIIMRISVNGIRNAYLIYDSR